MSGKGRARVRGKPTIATLGDSKSDNKTPTYTPRRKPKGKGKLTASSTPHASNEDEANDLDTKF